MGKDKEKDVLEESLEDEIALSFTKDTDEGYMVEDIDTEKEVPLKVRVKFSANLRQYPNHVSKLVKRLRDGFEIEVVDILEGSSVQLSNIWYQVDGGFVHASQVEVL